MTEKGGVPESADFKNTLSRNNDTELTQIKWRGKILS